MDEDGTVSLSQPQPQVEITRLRLTSTNPDNPDGNDITGTTWQWSKSMDMQDWMDIDGETSETYEPNVGDIGYYLRAAATYTDTLGEGKMAMSDPSENARVEAETSANDAPTFPEEDFNDDKT